MLTVDSCSTIPHRQVRVFLREAGLGGYGATAVVGRPVRRTAVTRWGCARGSVSLFPYIQDIQVGWWVPFDAWRLKVRDRFVFADQNFPYLGCPSVVAYVPRYFFHMVGPNDRIPDPLGTDFPDLDSAGLPAAKMALSISNALIIAGRSPARPPSCHNPPCGPGRTLNGGLPWLLTCSSATSPTKVCETSRKRRAAERRRRGSLAKNVALTIS